MKENSGIKIVLDILKTLFSLKSKLVGDIRVHMAGHDLSRSEVFALLHIYTGKKVNMGKLCREMDLKSGSLTSVIDNLVKKGYAERDYDPGDRRKVIVTVTGKGKEIAKKVCSYVEGNALAKIEKLTEEEKKEFFEALEVLERITNRLGV
ncbi:MAG: MarR family winged helix-turn-helix transcriptional regulator [Actinomycetota bacterium]